MKCVPKRLVVRVDLEQKNFYTFENGQTIRLERGFDNFDRRYTEQVMGVVVDAEYVPKDSFILFHHNSLHETYKILNHSTLSGKEIASGIQLFSIMERDCFFWKKPNEKNWNSMAEFATALRVYKPYNGIIQGIEPKLIKDVLWVTSGKYKGLCCHTIKAVDYEITFRDESGRDKKILRIRPEGNEDGREPELTAINHTFTKMIKQGELYIGLSATKCKPVKELVPND